MRWQSGRRSGNVEDRRGMPGGRVALGGGTTLALALVVYLMGGDPTGILLNGLQQGAQQSTLSPEQEAEQKDFVSSVLGSTEDVWKSEFEKMGRTYTDPKLVLFTGATNSACGYAQSAIGPFYCPVDQKVYLDLDFFQMMQKKLNAPGDFARAYVIAHEVGHHVQKLTGTEEKVRGAMEGASEKNANALSVKLELQADCYAGVWAYHAGRDYNLIEEGDIDEALNAASQIGDDALQTKAQGYAVPDSFTHGTSAQRSKWFKTGYESGDPKDCDTFR
jgi:hypothetical protein